MGGDARALVIKFEFTPHHFDGKPQQLHIAPCVVASNSPLRDAAAGKNAIQAVPRAPHCSEETAREVDGINRRNLFRGNPVPSAGRGKEFRVKPMPIVGDQLRIADKLRKLDQDFMRTRRGCDMTFRDARVTGDEGWNGLSGFGVAKKGFRADKLAEAKFHRRNLDDLMRSRRESGCFEIVNDKVGFRHGRSKP